MLDSEKKKLYEMDGDYLNIGISPGGIVYTGISIPWERTVHAYNMHMPNIYFAEEDMQDPEILNYLKKFHILGCYIFTPLEDYSFLAEFTELWDLHIRKGYNISDLSFIKGMKELCMFYLEDAKLEKLDNIFEQQSDRLHSNCLGLCNCEIKDISSLEKSIIENKTIISELLIINKKGKNERKRWRNLKHVLGYYYFEYE